MVASELPEGVADLAGGLRTSRAQSLALDQVANDSDRQALLVDPPPWATEALGEPPLIGPDRQRWAERAAQIASYRDAHGVTDERSPIGPEPEWPRQRRDWELAQLALVDQQSLDLERGLTR